jgi:hypothetical protein
LECLLLPSLGHLCIGEATFASFIRHPVHFDGLTVHINPSSFPQTTILQVLEMIPGISRLRLSPISMPSRRGTSQGRHHLDDSLIAALTPTPDHSPICPILTHIGIISDSPTFSCSSIVPFVRARAANGLPLQTVYIRMSNQAVEVDVLPDLQESIEGGLQVEITYMHQKSWPSIWRYSPAQGLLPSQKDTMQIWESGK